MNKQKLLLLGKVSLFVLAYLVAITLLFDLNIVGQILPKTLCRPLYMVARGGFCLLIGFVLLLLFVKIIDKEKVFPSKWFSLKNRYKDFLVGGLFGSICIFIAFLFPAIFNWEQIEILPLRMNFLLSFLFLSFCIAFMEECVFRGYLLRQLLTKFSPLVALLLSAVSFAALHLLLNDYSSILLIAIINFSLASIFLGLLYLKTKNIWLAVGFHAFWNYTQSILGMDDAPSILSLNFEYLYLFEFTCTIILVLSIVFLLRKIKLFENQK